jgi:hypothetical protein
MGDGMVGLAVCGLSPLAALPRQGIALATLCAVSMRSLPFLGRQTHRSDTSGVLQTAATGKAVTEVIQARHLTFSCPAYLLSAETSGMNMDKWGHQLS